MTAAPSLVSSVRGETYLDEFIRLRNIKLLSLTLKFIIPKNPLPLSSLNQIEIDHKRINRFLPSFANSNNSPLLGLNKHKIILFRQPRLIVHIVLLTSDGQFLSLLLAEIAVPCVPCSSQIL